jgi:hypothetical protein
MNAEPVAPARSPSDLQAEAAFKDWVRRLVKGVAERQALETGQVDAVIDPTTATAILLPEAQAALQGSNGRDDQQGLARVYHRERRCWTRYLRGSQFFDGVPGRRHRRARAG